MSVRGMPRLDAQARSAVGLSSQPWMTSTPSLAARAATTPLVSVDRISSSMPAFLSIETPMPSDRLTVTDSMPFSSTVT